MQGSRFIVESEDIGKYHYISEAVTMKNFSLQSRIMASLNLADMCVELKENFQNMLYQIMAEAVYVNPENGDVKILVEKCFGNVPLTFDKRKKQDYLICKNEIKSLPIGEKELLRFAVYSTFRLLCVENPYDGKKTLVQYPFLSQKAIELIHTEKNGILVKDGENSFSDYIGKNALLRWKAIPTFLRTVIEKELQEESQISLSEWLVCVRRLRDCLVYIKGQAKMCDPDAVNNVLFLKVGEYKIPIWPRKAIYGYHIWSKTGAEAWQVVAGVNAVGELENKSHMQWVAEYDDSIMIIYPGRSVKPLLDMKIKIEDMELQVISGEPSPVLKGTEGGLSDYLSHKDSESSDIDDKKEADEVSHEE